MTNTSVSLKWSPPADNGGAEIFNYVIEYRVEGGFKWVQANTDNVSKTSYKVVRLIENNIYEFRISAENKADVGPASDPTSPVKAKEPVGECFRPHEMWFNLVV